MILTGRARLRKSTRAERLRTQRVQAVRPEALEEPLPRAAAPARRRAARRRYDMALPVAAGAAMSLPALPIIRPGPRLASGALLAAVVFALYSLLAAPQFIVDQARVAGATLLSESQVRSLAGVDGMSVFQVDPRALVERLLAVPELAAVELRVRWPNRVEIAVQERHPIAVWDDGGRAWWLTGEGIAFLERGEWPGVVHLASVEPMLAIGDDPLAPAVDPRWLQAAAVLASQLPAETVLTVDPDHGLMIPGGGSAPELRFGFEGDMVMKVRMARFLVGHLAERGVQPALISVEDLAAPYYRVDGAAR